MKKKIVNEVLEATMLEDGLSRLQSISSRQPLPTQHFFKELDELVREAVVAAYNSGVEDGKTNSKKKSFPVEKFSKV